ncbi:MAG TPA: pyruvate, phosphate dikinase [Thermomicrobiales bacterium]|nr:pyruvate, phosphate dikinase [Thermomicrobiales bacterium]
MGRWIRLFTEGDAGQRALLGGKGANLAEMTQLGLPIPPGFTVTTEACLEYLRNNGRIPEGLWEEVEYGIRYIEGRMGRRFGDPDKPLLLSVRSGAAASMPGMMDTILNIGLNDTTTDSLGAVMGERFALDAYRRLIQMFGKVVLGAPSEKFDDALSGARLALGVKSDHELTPVALRRLIIHFREILHAQEAGLPDDPVEQVREAILAVFRSFNTERAISYRQMHGLSENMGTAANVQAMVFGNMGSDSATGVAFTRDPNTGAPGLFGEFLQNAQGEDIVAGVRTPRPVSEMFSDAAFRAAGAQLQAIADQLEAHFTDMQDIEFTVEQGRLWILQTRTGKRTAQAAVRIAVDLAEAGSIDRREAIHRVSPTQIELLLHPHIDSTRHIEVVATGLPASPGAATGTVVLNTAEARRRGEAGEAILLVRPETAADDFPGMRYAQGILTARGGMTSHAAVVARGMGTPAVTGCSALEIDERAGVIRVGSTVIRAGDDLTIDGSTGHVILGKAAMIQAHLDERAERLLSWADETRRMKVRANADTPADAQRARGLGAEGIGLCRTEHMFFTNGRLPVIRTLILSEDRHERERALAKLERFQTDDFASIFRAMDGLPVTIRTLDPPLHEFLPTRPEEIAKIADRLNMPIEEIEDRIDGLHEANPMLGHRGCRLGMTVPEITEMQARAIFRAALRCAAEGVVVLPEIMIPLVSDIEELRRQRRLIDGVAGQLFEQAGRSVEYHVGTMIELPRAALRGADLAQEADFFSYGTNDLTQTTYGLSRDDAGTFLPQYLVDGVYPKDPFQVLDRDGVGELIQIASERGRSANPTLELGVCGEHGGDPESIQFCNEIGLDYVSCSPFRVPIARLAAAHAALGSEAAVIV